MHKRRIGARNGFSPNVVESIKVRHSAILGLCAFINAQPYQVPNYIPDVFEILGNHLNDPQPIPVSWIWTINRVLINLIKKKKKNVAILSINYNSLKKYFVMFMW